MLVCIYPACLCADLLFIVYLQQGVLVGINKMQEQVELLSYAQKLGAVNTSSQLDPINKYGFDPRLCATCKSNDVCSHNVIDTSKSDS